MASEGGIPEKAGSRTAQGECGCALATAAGPWLAPPVVWTCRSLGVFAHTAGPILRSRAIHPRMWAIAAPGWQRHVDRCGAGQAQRAHTPRPLRRGQLIHPHSARTHRLGRGRGSDTRCHDRHAPDLTVTTYAGHTARGSDTLDVLLGVGVVLVSRARSTLGLPRSACRAAARSTLPQRTVQNSLITSRRLSARTRRVRAGVPNSAGAAGHQAQQAARVPARHTTPSRPPQTRPTEPSVSGAQTRTARASSQAATRPSSRLLSRKAGTRRLPCLRLGGIRPGD